MSKKRLVEFDDLIASYYGAGSTPSPNQRAANLFDTYYGLPAKVKPRQRPASTTMSLSLGCDDGEIISPSRRRRAGAASFSQSAALDGDEYVIDAPAAADAGRELAGRALAGDAGRDFKSDAPAAPAPPAPPSAAVMPAPPTMDAEAPLKSGDPAMSLSATEADILGDLEAIVRGQKVYDKERGGMVDRSSAPSRNDRPSPTVAPNGQEIFDRIAQSMQYANAYDLGTVELENRFADFDRQDDQRRTSVSKKPSAPAVEVPVRPLKADNAEFLADLDTIKAEAAGSVSRAESLRETVSTPLYDTGEHVLAGGSNYPERLRVGKGAGVFFSYGQIIAMADLYDTVDDLRSADVGELNRLKSLIVRNTSFYEGKKANRGLDVSNDEWDAATKGRYLKLAENNYEHFSPAYVTLGTGVRTVHGDNRSQWEAYHKRAIQAAQEMFVKATGKVEDFFFEWPLTINAFGDHFLTDAFSAGHLINKEALMDRFRTNFYNGSSLKDVGGDFFEKVAKEAWKGEVERQFSQLETVDWAHWHGIPLPFHPNINSASRFGTLLQEAAKQQPDRVSNLIVKALHDKLNDDGIEVTNRGGDGTWILPGDGSMMIGSGRLTPADLAKNLNVMRKAVQQSIDDINSHEIRASNIDFQKFMNGVWRYVPELTATSRPQMTVLLRDFTDPTSTVLVQAAAKILNEQLKSFIAVLKAEGKLKAA